MAKSNHDRMKTATAKKTKSFVAKLTEAGSGINADLAELSEQPAIAVPMVTVPDKKEKPPKWRIEASELTAPEPVSPKADKRPKPPKHKHVLHGRLPNGSTFSGTYTHTGPGEFDGYWDAVLTVPAGEESIGGKYFPATNSFAARASGWFGACVKADRLYRAALEVKS